MAFNQIINAIAYSGNSSILDSIEGIFDDKLAHTVYVDNLIGVDKNGTGSLIRPVKSLHSALLFSRNYSKLVVAAGNYSLPTNITEDYALFVQGDRAIINDNGIKFVGQIIFNSQCKDCYFRDIIFVDDFVYSNGANPTKPILLFGGYGGNAVFENCTFIAGDGDTVVSFDSNFLGNCTFKNCNFSTRSVITTSGASANIYFINNGCTTPVITLLEGIYNVRIDGGNCSKIEHIGGVLVLDRVRFFSFEDAENCLVSSAVASEDSALSLLFVNTQNLNDGSKFGKINKTGNCVSWHCNVVKPINFNHDFGNSVNISG
ncbi:MAG: hypothetical protein JJW01_02885 [Alphaproteobacteria bacterium]|nr:hypothetical protein [Rickettsiales bacterium]